MQMKNEILKIGLDVGSTTVKIVILNEKLYSKRLPLNNGTEKTFNYKGWSGLKGVIANYVAEKAVAGAEHLV